VSVDGYAEIIRDSTRRASDIDEAALALVRVALDYPGGSGERIDRIREVLAAGDMVRDEYHQRGRLNP
jgi:hypothetical protein